MNRNTVLELILIVSVASIWISGVSALPAYLDAYNTTFSTNASCGICHVNPAGGGPRTAYGMLFENQSNHMTDPSSALKTIGQAPIATPTAGAITTATSTALATSTATVTSTATLIATPLPFNATPTPTPTSVLIETPIAVETTTIVETPIPTPTPTPSTPGFELGVLIAGLLACYFILKRRNNN